MSLSFNKYVPPQHCQVRFDWKSGTPVRVTTLSDGTYEGEIVVGNQPNNQMHLELVNASKLYSSKGKNVTKPLAQFVRFGNRELLRVEVLGPPNVKSFPRKTEKLHQTLIITTISKFDKFESVLELEKPTEVGINFYGLDVGRGGELFLIVLFVMDTIAIMDYRKLVDECNTFMARLDTLLFSNKDVLKVAYNSRPIADFLYHYHSIYLKNVFDIQVAEFYLWARGQKSELIESTVQEKLKYRLLSDCLEEFIEKNVIPDQEIDILKQFEGKQFTELTHPLKEIPVPDENIKAMKWVAIEIKHLLALREAMTKRMLEKFLDCVSTNMRTHVGLVGFHPSYDHSDRLAIPATVINKFIVSKDGVSVTGSAAAATQSANKERPATEG